MAMRAAAMVRTNSNGHRARLPCERRAFDLHQRVDRHALRMRIEAGKLAISAARSRRDSPMPTMPPQQTLMPAPRTRSSVSSRSS